MSRHAIPIDEARAAFDVLGSWPKVAKVLQRPDGSRYQWPSIFAAVRRADKVFDPTNDRLRREIARLHDRIHELEELQGLHEEFPPEWRLGRLESMLLGLLLRRQLVSMETAQVALYEHIEDASERGVKWALERLRRAGFAIQNKTGLGWFIATADKIALRKAVNVPSKACGHRQEMPGNTVQCASTDLGLDGGGG